VNIPTLLDFADQIGDIQEMSTATVEQFQSDPASLLAAVEHGETVLIARGTKPVARLLPIEEAASLSVEREDWLRAAEQNLLRAYGPDEPEYGPGQIIEPNPHFQPSHQPYAALGAIGCAGIAAGDKISG
jgi:prevent-host-death family protein